MGQKEKFAQDASKQWPNKLTKNSPFIYGDFFIAFFQKNNGRLKFFNYPSSILKHYVRALKRTYP